MADPDLIFSDPDPADRDVAVALITVGLVVAVITGIAAWLGPTVLSWIALTALGVTLGATIWLALQPKESS